MYPDAYCEWLGLFDDKFTEIFRCERKELQKVALLLCALQKELKTVQTNVEVEVSNLKQQLKYKDDLVKQTKSIDIVKKKSPNLANKENTIEKANELRPANQKTFKNEKQINKESPDLFKDIDLNKHCSSTDLSIIDLSISEDDSNKNDGSPTIKKRKKRYKPFSTYIPQSFDTITEKEEKPVTPVRIIRQSVKTNLFKTPVPQVENNLSIIECTPEITPKKSKIASRTDSLYKGKQKKYRKGNNTTLTQIFKSSKMKSSGNIEADVDSDETYLEDDTDESKMGITRLLQYINKEESIKQETDSFGTEGGSKSETFYEYIDTSSQEVDQFSKGTIFDEEDIHSSTEKTRPIKIGPEPVVRGKARNQLAGFSCKACKDFYGNLPPDEMQKKIDQCSRHRYKYRPPEDTVPGGCLTIVYYKSQQVHRDNNVFRRFVVRKKKSSLLRFLS